MAQTITPEQFDEAAAALAAAAAEHRPVRFVGGATKLGWGGGVARGALRISTVNLNATICIQPADRIATFEAGVTLARAEAELAEHGLTLGLDPPASFGERDATIGGIIATADSGPMAHSGGHPTRTVLDVTVALSDGTIAHTGAGILHGGGYGASHMMIGSYGTLGLILAVTLRVRALPTSTATVHAISDSADALTHLVAALNRESLPIQSLDYGWRQGRGGLLIRLAGESAEADALSMTARLESLGLRDVNITHDDGALWNDQRLTQRSRQRAIVRVSSGLGQLAEVLALCDRCDALAAGRAALGVSYLTVNVNQISELRAGLPVGTNAVVLDLPQSARGAVNSWPVFDRGRLALMHRVKMSLDPAGVCNPGILGGEI